MIEFNDKTKQDFLDREWAQRLLDAGVDMSDAKYFICSLTIGSPVKSGENIQVALEEELPWIKDMPGHLPALQYNWACPTYTVSELLAKLPNHICLTIDDIQYFGNLIFEKDELSCIVYYNLRTISFRDNEEGESLKRYDYICAENINLIEVLASLVIECKQKGIELK